MFTLAQAGITALVVSFGLSDCFNAKASEASSSVRRTIPPWPTLRLPSSNSQSSRRRRNSPGSFRPRKF
jgi:hypothetical protein